MSTDFVSYSYSCSRETRELGESYPALKEVDAAYRALEAALERAVIKVTGETATLVVCEFGALLNDARGDASFGSTLLNAEAAFQEAKVVQIRRRPELRIVNP